MKAMIFPGQGSQFLGMGKTLFREFSDLVDEASEELGYSVDELCLYDPEGKLHSTLYTQPSVYVVSTLSYLSAMVDNTAPDYVAGHSLGEYSALFASGALDFISGLRLVSQRARLMSSIENGAMAAIVGLHEEDVRRVLLYSGLTALDIANINAPEQIVISGPRELIAAAKSSFVLAGAKHYILLKVSGAFHSRYMEAIVSQFDAYLKKIAFGALAIPVISNVTAREYRDQSVRQMLSQQLIKPVLWEQSIRYLRDLGVTDFQEIGPGSILSRLISRI